MKRIVIILGLLSTWLSCEKEIDLEIPEGENLPVLNCIFTPDSTWLVQLSLSADVLTVQGYETLPDAEVQVWAEGVLQETLNHTVDGFYKSNVLYPEPGVEYEIKVSTPTFDDLSAKDKIPLPTTMNGLEIIDSVTTNGSGEMLSEIRFQFEDVAGENNFYALSILQPDIAAGLFDTVYFFNPIQFSSTDPILNEYFLNGVLFSDELFDGDSKEVVIRAPTAIIRSNKKSILYFATVSENYYRYRTSVNRSQESSGPDLGEPVVVHTNIQNGLGIFAGFTAMQADLDF